VRSSRDLTFQSQQLYVAWMPGPQLHVTCGDNPNLLRALYGDRPTIGSCLNREAVFCIHRPSSDVLVMV
jgi:hypothetical protein